MLPRGRGRIVNMASVAGLNGTGGGAAYIAAKHGVVGLTRQMSVVYGARGITVNAMLPGPFATEMNQSLLDDPDLFKEFVAKIPLGRWGELHEIQGLALFLASDASSFITGAGITIDGGWTVY